MLAFAQENKCDVALLDIQMRSMRLHASGYIEKPVTEAKLRRELDDLRHPVDAAVRRC